MQAISSTTFSVSCTAPGVERKFSAFVYGVETKMSRQQALSLAQAVPKPGPNFRRDIRISTQLRLQAQRAIDAHENWVRYHSANTSRSPKDEQHYVKILALSAILRQVDQGSTRMSSEIARRIRQREEAKEEAEQQHPGMKLSNILSESQALDPNFVAKHLCSDIDLVYTAYGYATTMQTFSKLSPWEL